MQAKSVMMGTPPITMDAPTHVEESLQLAAMASSNRRKSATTETCWKETDATDSAGEKPVDHSGHLRDHPPVSLHRASVETARWKPESNAMMDNLITTQPVMPVVPIAPLPTVEMA